MTRPQISKIVQRSIRRAIAICGTQEILAYKAGISQQAIGKYLYSGSIPRGPTALKLSQAVDGRLTPSDFAPDCFAGILPMTTVLDN